MQERVSAATVGKWRKRFVAGRLDGLVNEPRTGRPRTIGDEQVKDVLVRTLETAPKGATHWSTRSMAAESGLSREAVDRIWRSFGLQPHRVETWKLSKAPVVRRQGARCRRPVPRAARTRRRALRR